MDVDPLLGRTLARRFRLDHCIGRGGMATVYAAVDAETGAEVAVKVLKRELSRDPMVTRRFEREAKAAAKLTHPHTIRIVDHGVDGSEAFIAMELASGRDLLKALGEERPMNQHRAALIGAQICEALEAAHERGIVHRDLKPENVMLTEGPTGPDHVKVLDFGIAKIVEAKAAPEAPAKAARARDADASDPPSYITQTALTRAGTIVGTPAYMSPEQCRGGELDGRSDLYACGVLLYQLLTGELPFTGETPLHTAMRHIHAPPRPPTELRADLDPELERVVLKALSKLPVDRHASAAALAQELRAVADRLPAPPGRAARAAASPPARSGGGAAEETSQLVGGPLGGTPLRAVRLGGPMQMALGASSPADAPDEVAAADDDDDDEPRTFLMQPPDPPAAELTPVASPALKDPSIGRRTLVGVPEAMGASGTLTAAKRPAPLGGGLRVGGATSPQAGADERLSALPAPPAEPRSPGPKPAAAPLEAGRPAPRADANGPAQRTVPLRATQRSRGANDPEGLARTARGPAVGGATASDAERARAEEIVARAKARPVRATETGLTPTTVGERPASPASDDDLGNATIRITGGEGRAVIESITGAEPEAPDSDEEPRTFIRSPDEAQPRNTTLVMDESAARARMAEVLSAPTSVVIDGASKTERADPLLALRATAPARRPGADERSGADLGQLKATMKMPPRASEPPPAQEQAAPPSVDRSKEVQRTLQSGSPARSAPLGNIGYDDSGTGLSHGGFRQLPQAGWAEPTKVTKKPARAARFLDELPGTMGLLIGIGIGLGIAAGAVIAVILWR